MKSHAAIAAANLRSGSDRSGSLLEPPNDSGIWESSQISRSAASGSTAPDAASTDCTSTCAGDGSLYCDGSLTCCGGGWANSVFELTRHAG